MVAVELVVDLARVAILRRQHVALLLLLSPSVEWLASRTISLPEYLGTYLLERACLPTPSEHFTAIAASSGSEGDVNLPLALFKSSNYSMDTKVLFLTLSRLEGPKYRCVILYVVELNTFILSLKLRYL